ncbi:MAG: hypothetical protein KGH76_06360 [Thaumarchaeota archaeon]|nr:hypothetical protein [Nitrososphaerota archaeon]MDE1842536.1 hypothetical protein [Nitrososphaerota archaeon]
MKKDSGNVDLVVSLNGVKLHRFEPSNREIWTVVGKENEHWLDPDLEYCSCENYYYDAMEKGKQCYHMKAVRAAKEQNKVEIVRFEDSEFPNFMYALVQDLM